MADISQIKLPNGDIFNLVDESKSTATNWVNGSQTGSVRTINSKAEDSSYTIGTYAVAEGHNTKANGDYGSHAEGTSTTASGNYSHAEGGGATASGGGAHAEGGGTTASGENSHAEGGGTQASGSQAHAEGGSSVASASNAHAEGYDTRASALGAHAEGNGTKASGSQSHAEGFETEASGATSHAEGTGTIANHNSQHVFGRYNISDSSAAGIGEIGNYIEIVGNGTNSNARSNARTLDWSGNEVLAGKLTVGVAGTNSLDVATIGQLPMKTSDLTNDSNFISDSAYIHTDNNYTTIEKNKLSGIAEGAEANVNADWNENDSTSASYIQNRPFYFEEDAEAVIFEQDVNFASTYNGINWNTFSYAFTDAMAVGTPVKLTVDDITLDATIEAEGTSLFIGIRDPSDSTRAATNHIGLGLGGSNGYAYQTAYVLALASMVSTGTHHVKLATIADVYHKIDSNFLDLNIENGSGSISVQQKWANASGDHSSAFGSGTATGGYAHAEGNGTSASKACTHAEGAGTTASAQCAHAEGSSTTASGDNAHAEGVYTTASGQDAHAEGSFTTASGPSSHAEGNNTIANHIAQHVFGQYNIADPSAASAAAKGNYVEIVGNGTGTSARSNARTLDWAGNEVLAGKLTVGAVGVNSMDVATVGQIPNVPSWAMASTKPTYTANEVGALPATTTIPSKTSELTNDSGFITSSALPTNLSDLTNDCGFAKIHISTAEPTSTDGDDGDIWIQYTE